VGKDDNLRAGLSAFMNPVDRVVSPETIEAGKRVIKDDDLVSPIWVLFELCQKKSER
jgi:hypothetical protein